MTARRPNVALLLGSGAAILSAALAAGFLREAGAAPPADAPGKYFGASSCSGANCHAAAEPRATPPGLQEYTTWSTVNPETQLPQDRHNYAYNRLYEDRSKEIMAALNKAEGTQEEATDSDRCLTCHGVSVHDYGTGKGGVAIGKRKDLQGGKYEPADGVSCDGCHGPAEKWLKPHTEKEWAPKKWRELGSEKLYNELGIYYSKDAVLWASQCVRCHLAMDTNLLEAGHPDLVPFELSGQSQAVPPHWRDYQAAHAEKELPASGAFHGIHLWQTGQAVALAAAAKQVALRARGEKHNKADPRFIREAVERASGHWALLQHALKRAAPEAAKAIAAQMAALEAAGAGDKPDPAKVAAAADEVAKTVKPLARTLADGKIDDAYAKGVLADVAADPGALASRRTAEQTIMGLYAIYASWLAKANPATAADPSGDAVMTAIYEGFGPLAGPEPHKDAAFKGALEKVKAGLPK